MCETDAVVVVVVVVVVVAAGGCGAMAVAVFLVMLLLLFTRGRTGSSSLAVLFEPLLGSTLRTDASWLIHAVCACKFAAAHREPWRLRWASTRRDVIPAELCDAMGTLHENVPTTMHLARRLESILRGMSDCLYTAHVIPNSAASDAQSLLSWSSLEPQRVDPLQSLVISGGRWRLLTPCKQVEPAEVPEGPPAGCAGGQGAGDGGQKRVSESRGP